MGVVDRRTVTVSRMIVVKWLRSLLWCLLLSTSVGQAQTPPGLDTPNPYNGGFSPGVENLYVYASVEVEIKGPKGAPVEGAVVVSLIRQNGQVFKTATAQNGKVLFANVPKSSLTAEVLAPGYQTAKKTFEIGDKTQVKVEVELQPMTDREAAAADRGISALNPKAQKDIGKALDALRANRPADARNHLQDAQRDAPNSAEVEYLYGVYASQMGDQSMAQTHWARALELNPNHLSSLLAVSQSLLQQHKGASAAPYLTRALEIEPSSWRAHMLMAQSYLFQGQKDQAIKEAERALELGHEQAASVGPLLAHALYENGEKDRGIQLLTEYVVAHPSDTNAAKLLERLKNPTTTTHTTTTATSTTTTDVPNVADEAVAAPSNWLPPDVDEKIPAVEPGAACSLNDVVEKAGQQIQKFTHDVDRFTATESLTHESINRYGIASSPEKRKFDYLVSIQEVRQGYLGVTEYRNGGGAQDQFPDGLVTNGLPALVLIFHPYYAPNYDMTCEGLARTNAGLAWQVHFRQIPGKPNELKTYQFGINGPSYAVALKGRAWISADNYQIVRMETDIVKPMPEIKLLAEHTTVEYGPVAFQKDSVNLWLPQSAEVYLAWRGRQVHRRHSFSNYLLFAVDDKERIEAPKNVEPSASAEPAGAAQPQTKN